MTAYKLWDTVPGLCEEEPILEFYPSITRGSDATVIICPGGAYKIRAPHEGQGYAEYFNTIGMNAFVCQYRVAPHRFPLPLLDIRRAVRYVRAHAEQFGIDPDKIAVMGSSAGGHLAALVSTYTAPIEHEGVDEIDAISPLPNATILCYPVIHRPDETGVGHKGSFSNLLGPDMEAHYADYSCDELVSDTTPPAFLWYTANDPVNVINAYLYATALHRHGIPHEMHTFHEGPHGLGLAPKHPHVAQWAPLMRNWLSYMGWIK